VNDYGKRFFAGSFAEVRIAPGKTVTVPVDQGLFVKP
jgi:hypothetical protein